MKENKIAQSNDLIESKYKMNLQQQRIFLSAISKINWQEDNFLSIQITATEYACAFNLEIQTAYTELASNVSALMKKTLFIHGENGVDIEFTLMSEARYDKGNAFVELSFNEKLRPYLVDLQKRFTNYKLKEIVNFKSVWAIRIYEIIIRYDYKKDFSISLFDLKKRFCIEKKYKQVGQLKEFVLEKARSEINNKTNYEFNFEDIKEGRKIIGFRFYWEKK